MAIFEALAQADEIKAKIEELSSARIAEGAMWFSNERQSLTICVSYNPNTDSYIANLYCFDVQDTIELSDEWLKDLEIRMHNQRVKFWKETYQVTLPPLKSVIRQFNKSDGA